MMSLMGYDLDLIKLVSNKINCPILALGGAGNWRHILIALSETDISAACTQNIFIYREYTVSKNFKREQNQSKN